MFLSEPSNGIGNSVPMVYAFRKQVSLNSVLIKRFKFYISAHRPDTFALSSGNALRRSIEWYLYFYTTLNT
jgi:hypothetical protein